jgi:hypothetical protein
VCISRRKKAYVTVYMFNISLNVFLKMRNIWDKSCRENQNKYFMFKNFFPENRAVEENVEIYCRAGQATDNNMVHAHCMLATLRLYIHRQLCNTHCFSTPTMPARTRLSVTLNVHWLYCYDGVCLLRGTAWIFRCNSVDCQAVMLQCWRCSNG